MSDLDPTEGGEVHRSHRSWSTRKKDEAPRGLFRHPSEEWGIRYTCGAGHIHQEKAGPIKTVALRAYHDRRARAHDEPGWCPKDERRRARERALAERQSEARRLTFGEYAGQYLIWSRLHHRGWRTEESRIDLMKKAFGEMKLDAITARDVDSFLDGLLQDRSHSTRNRYRTLLHAMFNRAMRHGHASTNPVKGVGKFKEPEGRIKFLLGEEEVVVRDALHADLQPLFAVSVHTGLRWSEQLALEWQDVDVLIQQIRVRQSKTGYTRQVPMNSIVRSVLFDLAAQRRTPNDPEEPVFACLHKQPDKFFPKAVERARKALLAVGRDASRLDGYTWHCNRHTFASRLVMAGVDLRSIQALGGWRTLAMVQRYSHLAPDHLREAVERLVPVSLGPTELRENFESGGPTSSGVS
jgi:site-specific recombinase XerD